MAFFQRIWFCFPDSGHPYGQSHSGSPSPQPLIPVVPALIDYQYENRLPIDVDAKQ
jgi:hypothetical protein